MSRLFTGMETSLLEKKWRPTGVPTIYKFTESLAKSDIWNSHHFFCQKSGFTAWNEKQDIETQLEGFPKKVKILVNEAYFPNFIPLKIRKVLRELRQALVILNFYRKNKPEIVYIDHANTLLALIFARLTKAKVIYRVMGIYPFMRNCLVGNDLKSKIFRYAYSSPYDLVICTQDGTAVEEWLDRAIREDIETIPMFNGVQLNTDDFDGDELENLTQVIPSHATTVLFVGRLEPHKGCVEFTEAMIKAVKKDSNLFGLIIGFGSQKTEMEKLISENGLQKNFHFIERLPHSQILRAQGKANIYVSLNKLGNFSNANLEAMRLGRCLILPLELPPIGHDKLLDETLPKDSYHAIPGVFSTDILSEKILELKNNPQAIENSMKKIKVFSEEFIPTWQERVKKELDILEKNFL